MPCSPRMLKCKTPCAHRELVQSYNLAYLAWVEQMEKECGDHESEQVLYRNRHPAPLFKDWLKHQGAIR